MNESHAPDSRLLNEKESARQQNVSNNPAHNEQQQAQRAWSVQEAATDASAGQRQARANATQAGKPAAPDAKFPAPTQAGIQTGRGPQDDPAG